MNRVLQTLKKPLLIAGLIVLLSACAAENNGNSQTQLPKLSAKQEFCSKELFSCSAACDFTLNEPCQDSCSSNFDDCLNSEEN